MLALEFDFRNPGFEAALALKKVWACWGCYGAMLLRTMLFSAQTILIWTLFLGGIASEDTNSLMRGLPPDLTSLATTYDVVVINGPLRTSQKKIGSQLAVDTVVFCCKSNHSVMGRALNALSEIKANGFAKVGLVLTMVQPNSGDHQKSLAGGLHASAVLTVPKVLFVEHTGEISGAEMVLLDLIAPWVGGSAFIFARTAF